MDYLMDKSWMYGDRKHRYSDTFIKGVAFFVEFAFKQMGEGSKEIRCPCAKCKNRYWKDGPIVHDDLVYNGFVPDYYVWNYHGEDEIERDDIQEPGIGNDMPEMNDDEIVEDINNDNVSDCGPRSGRDDYAKSFKNLVNEVDKPLYAGCKFSQLSFIVRIFNVKCLGGWSNKSFSMLLELLKDALPGDNCLPSNFYQMKKIIDSLGLGYTKIHACPNHCVLFRKELEEAEECPTCKASRYQKNNDDKSKKKIPAQVLWHFPVIPRLQQKFMSSKTANFMTWHDTGRTKDGKLRHPADSKSWKILDQKFPTFAADARNVRLGLASDGFNPFRSLNKFGSGYSTWPVILTVYNLPPWMCLKQPHLILSLLISGPKTPGKKIDVYLQPLIEELQLLWYEGVNTYDASKDETFRMRAAILWTINDFPAYGMLSGWTTQGYLACPCCHIHTTSIYLKNGRKNVYTGNRRFLPRNHRYRKDATSFFDQNVEVRTAPKPLSGSDVLRQFEEHIGSSAYPKGWNKKSIFFHLPYWKFLLVRHNLDVMHIEKNVCDNILNTLLKKGGKSTDNINTRLDLQVLGIRPNLHPRENANGKIELPQAPYFMKEMDKGRFLKVLKDIKVPDGYSSNISRVVNIEEGKISTLKSHDCHVLMQQLLPLAIRSGLPKPVGLALNDLCSFFKEICSKVIDVDKMEKLEKSIPVILCNLEKIFQPSFFDVMVHLLLHLPTEVKLAGPVQYRYMYFTERYLPRLRCYVGNKNRPEGSIAKGYLLEECMTFCSMYLDDMESRLTRPVRNPEGPIGGPKTINVNSSLRLQAQRFMLFSSDVITPYRALHRNFCKRQYPSYDEKIIDKMQHQEFAEWFRAYVFKLLDDGVHVDEEVQRLALGPNFSVDKYRGYSVNGYKFIVKSSEDATQNSGIVTIGGSGVDGDDVLYFGVLTDVLEFNFMDGHKQFLFKCDWFDVFTQSGMRVDEYKFTNLNKKRRICEDEPFIFPNSAEQVFYSSDPLRPDWLTVLRWKPRDFYDMTKSQPPREEAAAFHEFEPTSCDGAREIEVGDLVMEDLVEATLDLEEYNNLLDSVHRIRRKVMPPLRRIKRKSIGGLLDIRDSVQSFQVDVPPSSTGGGGDSHKFCGQEKHASSITSSGSKVKDNDDETCEYDEIWDADGSRLLMKKTIKRAGIGGRKYGKENRVVGTNGFHVLKKRQGSSSIRREKFNPNQEEVASGFPIDPPRQPQVLEGKNRYPRGQSADVVKVSTETDLSRLSSLVAAISYDGSLPREDENTGEKDCMMDPLRGFTGREKYKRPSLVTDSLDKPSSLIRNVVKDYGSEGYKIHYSVPVIAPSGNVDQMLKDHYQTYSSGNMDQMLKDHHKTYSSEMTGDLGSEPATVPRTSICSPSRIVIPPEIEEEALLDSIKEINKDGPVPSGVTLREYTTPPDGRIFSIRFDSIGKPVGPNAGKFSARCGIYARMGHLFPLDVMWKKQSNTSKSLALEELSRMFQCMYDLDFTHSALVTIRDRLREWRYTMKKNHYTPYLTDEERILNRHPRVEEGQWRRLLILWSTEAKMVESERNKLNKAKQVFKHTLGRQSFSVLRDKMASSSGKDVLFSTAYLVGHKKAMGGYHNNSTEDLMERVMMSISQPSSSSSISSGSSSTNMYFTDIYRLREIICDVTGKEDHGGYCRGLGSGITKRRLSNPMGTFQTLIQSNINQMKVEVERFKDDAKRAREEVESERLKRVAAEADAKAANARVEALENVQQSTLQMFIDLQRQFNEFKKKTENDSRINTMIYEMQKSGLDPPTRFTSV